MGDLGGEVDVKAAADEVVEVPAALLHGSLDDPAPP
jgi:hypothetical protein